MAGLFDPDELRELRRLALRACQPRMENPGWRADFKAYLKECRPDLIIQLIDEVEAGDGELVETVPWVPLSFNGWVTSIAGPRAAIEHIAALLNSEPIATQSCPKCGWVWAAEDSK